MDTKLKNEPLFLIASLCLFFPIGLIFLIKSEIKNPFKWILASGCALIFIGLLCLALLNRHQPVNPDLFDVSVTRNTLSPGQSGGLVVTYDQRYYTDYSVKAENDVLQLNGSVYTAHNPGECTLTVAFADQTRTARITVNDAPGTNRTILASPNGTRYHMPTAKHAGKKAIKMTEEDALLSGKTPCKTCFK